MMKRSTKIAGLAGAVFALAGIAFGIYEVKQATHIRPMQFYVGARVFTTQSSLQIYDENGRLLAKQSVTFPVTTRAHSEDRSVTVISDRSHVALQDSLNHTVFRMPLVGAGLVTTKSSYHGKALIPGEVPFVYAEDQNFSYGEGVKPQTPHVYTLVISPNYQSRFL